MQIKTIETACDCSVCKNMCKIQPCLGTPEDIVKIIMAGHHDKLRLSSWMVGMLAGITSDSIDMIQPLFVEGHGCAFLDDNNLCTLHESGLNPTEGKLSHHSDPPEKDFADTINFKVAMSWVDENNNNDPMQTLLRAERRMAAESNKKE